MVAERLAFPSCQFSTLLFKSPFAKVRELQWVNRGIVCLLNFHLIIDNSADVDNSGDVASAFF